MISYSNNTTRSNNAQSARDVGRACAKFARSQPTKAA